MCRCLSVRRPIQLTKKVLKESNKFHLLIGCTGSVAAMKLPELIGEVRGACPISQDQVDVRVVATEKASRFFDADSLQIPVFTDADEWSSWRGRGDMILHIELRRWADVLVISPLDANTMAKIANGLCDNLLTCVPLYFCPAMNTFMWEHPLTYKQMDVLKNLLGFKEIPCVEKELMCGDRGYGAMASVPMIASVIASEIKNHFAIYTG
ncbi:unnamed protein product [Soboliphyme baturini]|uniref:Flavoprotein domain-containing protein n=1 Tax=Soboliphyme baturini TaxID=241478 RepID=A0A183IP67_9BILA|nr:unnamed protein product [Soboliphyme baturini]